MSSQNQLSIVVAEADVSASPSGKISVRTSADSEPINKKEITFEFGNRSEVGRQLQKLLDEKKPATSVKAWTSVTYNYSCSDPTPISMKLNELKSPACEFMGATFNQVIQATPVNQDPSRSGKRDVDVEVKVVEVTRLQDLYQREQALKTRFWRQAKEDIKSMLFAAAEEIGYVFGRRGK